MPNDKQRVQVQQIVESQIPSFLNEDSPLFREFLNQYYLSQEVPTGITDLAARLPDLKNIETYNNELFFTVFVPCSLTSQLTAFSDTINVSHTVGFPEYYGLLKIDDEIITYERKTLNSFEGCSRGFSGIDKISQDTQSEVLSFTTTDISEHSAGSVVNNLNLEFYGKLFTKFKAQFLPGFENRNFISDVKIKNILSRAIDFYTSKGTETSYKLLFNVLFNEKVSMITPQDYILRPSDDNYFTTQNVLVEKISGIDPLLLKGKTLFQDIDGVGEASAAIYSIEYRPIDGKDLYEIYLDSTSFTYNFIPTKKTNISRKLIKDDTTIYVDSTIGFPSSGSLILKSSNEPESLLTVSYTDKTNTQFLGVTGVIVDAEFGDELLESNFAYTYDDNEQKVEFRLINVIGELDVEETSNLLPGDTIQLSSFGAEMGTEPEFNVWTYNIPVSHNIFSIVKTPAVSGKIYRVTFYDTTKFYVDQKITLTNPEDENDVEVDAKVYSLFSDKIIEIFSNTDVTKKTILNTIINLGESDNNQSPSVNSIPTGIQNTYIDREKNYFYVSASGIPNYTIDSKEQVLNTFTSAGVGKTEVLETTKIHGFYTGEKIYYTPASGSGIATGIYHVTTVGNNKDSKQVKISLSKSDVFSKKYLNFDRTITNDKFIKLDFENKELKDQKLLKKFTYNKTNLNLVEISNKTTNNRPVGILVNGVEIYSPTLFDENIYYGRIDNVIVTNPGSGYDVINPPDLQVRDIVGSGATAYLVVNGKLEDVRIISPGVGYQIKPKITLVGGNGTGAIVEPNLIKSQIVSSFQGDGSGVNPTTDTITFPSKHNFDDGEQVIYLPNSNAEILPLRENSIYFVGKEDDNKVKLYKDREDAFNKKNFINLVGVSSGSQQFKSLNSKNTITKIYVKEKGENYSNRLVRVPSVLSFDNKTNGVNSFDDYIFAENHGFKNKDIIRYSHTGTSIGGLSTTSEYVVSIIDDNIFKLSDIGIGTVSFDKNFVDKRYIGISSLGIGTHTFAYPPIRLEVESLSGIAATTIIEPEFEPIVLGSIDSIFLESSGVGYGVSDIINFHRRPEIRIRPIDSEALLRPIIVNGSIVDVQFLSFGKAYDDGIDIVVTGKGNFADIRPVVENGELVEVKISNGGVGYEQNDTFINIVRRGRDAKFISNVFEWKLNQKEKNKNLLQNSDGGFIAPSKDKTLGLKLINFDVPKAIRKKLDDHVDGSNREVVNNEHSPIVGWSYDGNPIYGPYGQIGNQIQKIRSSYGKKVEPNNGLRPSFPDGFFLQDFYYDRALGDLDEHNGRFCITPEYPNGVYAYFATIDQNTLSNSEYPYVVGTQFKSYPARENYDPSFRNDLGFEKLDLIRNVSPYYINSSTTDYKLIQKTNPKYKQEFNVVSTLSSRVEGIQIYSPGDSYKVGDTVKFNNSGTNGSGISGSISKIKGKLVNQISVGIKTHLDVKFSTTGTRVTGTVNEPHEFFDGDNVVISDISDAKYQYLSGSKKIIVVNKTVGLSTDITALGVTGETTNIGVNDTRGFVVNDFIQIDTEILRILSIDESKSEFGVNRISSTGLHTVGLSSVKLLPTKFYFSEPKVPTPIKENTVVYFNPKAYVGFGTRYNNYSLDNGDTLSLPPGAFYIKDHNFTTGKRLRYNVGVNGSTIRTSIQPSQANIINIVDGSFVYAVSLGKDFLGIATTPTSIGSGNPLYIWNDVSVTGFAHSFTTTFDEIIGDVENYNLNVTTAVKHELSDGDIVKFNLLPRVSDSFKLRYDTKLRKTTSELIEFDGLVAVGTTESELYLPGIELNTGDKVVYYDGGFPTIGGLVDNNTYYVIKEKKDYIQLAEFYINATSGIAINLTSTSSGDHGIALVNPPLKSTKGNLIKFNLSDTSLSGMDLLLYKDDKFLVEIESYNYKRNSTDAGSTGAELVVDTQSEFITNNLFYNLIPLAPSIPEKYQISIDTEVIANNKVNLSPSTYSSDYEILNVDSDQFKFNLTRKPEEFSYDLTTGVSTIFYDTTSKNTSGPISDIKLNFGGKGYKRIPEIVDVVSLSGVGAILKTNSNSIGKVDIIERVKDGFDYPTDSTLKPVLSVPTICQIKGISRVESIGIVTGGLRYNNAPRLTVIGNDDLKLQAVIQGGSVVDVNILQNVSNLQGPLPVIATKNSNAYDIDDIVYNPVLNTVTLELVNSDTQQYPLISNQNGTYDIDFPFALGDQIFVENCAITQKSIDNGDAGYNSSEYGFKFFTVTGISTVNFTVTYSMDGIGLNLGEYNTDNNYGYVSNKNELAQFVMTIVDDLSYLSNENVIGYDSNNSEVFTAKVMESGWTNNINQLRLSDSKGELKQGDTLLGTRSRLHGTVDNVNTFNINSSLNVSREKVNDFKDKTGYLNDYQQRIADNNYYQKFSYALKSELPYETWKEPIRSLVHPAGFKEFSDLDIIQKPSNTMKVGVGDSSLNILINVDNVSSMYKRNNFSMVTEEDRLPDGSVERIFFPEGVELRPYILSLTNKVLKFDDISSKFTGISSDIGGVLVGLTTFKLSVDNFPVYYREFESNSSSFVKLDDDAFSIERHNFQSGQKIYYRVQEGIVSPIGLAQTTVDVSYTPPIVSTNFDSPVLTFDSNALTFDYT